MVATTLSVRVVDDGEVLGILVGDIGELPRGEGRSSAGCRGGVGPARRGRLVFAARGDAAEQKAAIMIALGWELVRSCQCASKIALSAVAGLVESLELVTPDNIGEDRAVEVGLGPAWPR